MCEGDSRSIVRLEADGTWTTLAERWQGKRLNRPNDIIRRSDGTYYFTDPILFVPKEERDFGQSIVWRLSPDGSLSIVSTEFGFPNGLALSPDESVLYVANSFLDERCMEERKRKEVCPHRYLAAFDVAADGSLANRRQVTDLSSAAHDVPDGLKVDVNGTIFCTGSGATWVLAPDGGVIGKIRTPDAARNVAFGDADWRTLYITALNTVYSLRTKAPGISGTGVDVQRMR
jgi:gluconolactonase